MKWIEVFEEVDENQKKWDDLEASSITPEEKERLKRVCLEKDERLQKLLNVTTTGGVIISASQGCTGRHFRIQPPSCWTDTITVRQEFDFMTKTFDSPTISWSSGGHRPEASNETVINDHLLGLKIAQGIVAELSGAL